MKKFILLLIGVAFVSIVSAQDRIVFRNADEKSVKVTSITDDTVTYLLWDNLDGPTYTTAKNNILFVVYANGKKEIINESSPSDSYKAQSVDNSQTLNVRAQGYLDLGCIFDSVGGGPTFDVNAGVRIYDYFYAGLATGIHTYFVTNYSEINIIYIPIGVNMKGYFTKNRKVNPFIDFTIGGCVGIYGGGGFHCKVGAGLDIKRFSFGIGYNNILALGHSGYIQLGVRLGKNQ